MASKRPGIMADYNSASALLEVGRHMERTKYQRGTVSLTGRRVKQWVGRYRAYYYDTEGRQRSVRRKVRLGLKAGMSKTEARHRLVEIIARDGAADPAHARPDDSVTFGWFLEHRFLPLHEQRWRPKTNRELGSFFRTHLLPSIGARPLREINRMELQTGLNALAGSGASASLVHKYRTWTRAILDEARVQRYIRDNPAEKLMLPRTRKTNARFLEVRELQRLIGALIEPRDRLIVRLLVLCGLRRGELFALRWNDVDGGRLRIDEAVTINGVGPTKTETSAAWVALPRSLRQELEVWRTACGDPAPEAFIFPSRRGGPLNGQNFMQRTIQPLAGKLGIDGVTFQALRRTTATLMQDKGTVKDAQAQLRHAQASTTLGIYMQPLDESVAAAVERLDRAISETDGEPVQ